MGGHAAGEVASALAAEVVRRVFYELEGAEPELLGAAFAAANQAIFEHSQNDPNCAGMGTTCTALAVRAGRAWLAHVGDSRAYIVRDGCVTQLSEDQTLVAQMVREGTLTEEQAKASDQSNVILQALGTQPSVKPDIWREGLPLKPGDILILCSDGLYNLVADEDIAKTAARLPPLEACQSLIESALVAGGHDNVSVGVFRAVAQSASAASPDKTTRRLVLPDELLAESDEKSTASATRRIAIPMRQL